MTIRCAWCKKTLGEKCGGCGETELRVIATEAALGEPVQLWNCPTCGKTWVGGDEPETHGVCEPRCPEAEKALDNK